MKNNFNLKKIMSDHRSFTKKYYDQDNFTNKQKEEMLKTISLAMHYEISEIVSSCNFKVFDKTNFDADKDKIVYNSIDVFRYLLAIMNLYEITSEDFLNSFEERDIQLKIDNSIKQPGKDQKVIVVDIDDVICDFRMYFNFWLYKRYNIFIDPDSTSYYSSKEVKDHGLSPESVFEEFISKNELLNIPVIPQMIEFLSLAKKDGIYIQLLTSRPEVNLKCKYQTYAWLEKNNVPFDNIGFAPEKYIWIAKKDFYLNGQLVTAIDDSPKHAMEYATHDVHVLVPKTEYNKDIRHENIRHFKFDQLNEYKF